jgi:hypothetical protein
MTSDQSEKSRGKPGNDEAEAPRPRASLLAGWHHADLAIKLLLTGGVLAMAGIIAAHSGLVNRGAWEPDEYSIIAGVRDDGISFMWDRFRSLSPRPLSEFLIFLYARSVVFAQQQIIVPALLVLWTAFLASASPALTGTRVTARRLLGVLAVLAFMVLGNGAFEVFYWPIGAVAYLPVLSSALFLLFLLSNEHHRAKPNGAITAMVLVAAAWSAEAGALLVLFFVGALAVTSLLRRDIPDATVVAWGAPVLAAALVVGLVTTDGRLMVATGIQGSDPALVHHWAASMAAAAKRAVLEFLSADAETFDPPHILIGILIKSLFFAGVHLCWLTPDPAVRRGRRGLLPLAFAVLATAFATLVVGFWNNGTTCCQRHNLLRQDFGFLALAALAIWMPPAFPAAGRWAAGLAPVLLTAAALLAIAPRARDIALDYRFYTEPNRARAQTWASGFSPGPDMMLWQPVPDALFNQAMPPGTWRMGDNWWIGGVLRFFGKQSVQVSLADSHVKRPRETP